MGKLLVATIVATLILTTLAQAEDFPSTSAMAVLDSTHFLLVDDTMDRPELAQRPRLRVAKMIPSGTVIETVNEDWGDGPKPHDLEAIAPFPGQPDRFLIAESGHGGEPYGRIYYVQVSRSGNAWSSKVFGQTQIPPGLLHGELEGIALGAKSDGSMVLVLTERGGSGPYSPGWMWWGNFNLSTGEFTRTEEQMYGQQLSWPNKTYDPGARACTDLYLDNSGYMWSCGAEHMGDNGPFRSVIYRIGRFDPNLPYPIMYEMNSDMVWRIDGLKIEALGPSVTEGSILTFATDDEHFGGIWRPLPPADPQPQQHPYYGEYGG